MPDRSPGAQAMTDARLAALEAVAEAARKWLIVVSGLPYQNQGELDAMDVCEKALHTLDALPTPAPQPAGCISAAPTGCVSDSECAAAGRCLERPALPTAPEPAGEVVEVRVNIWRNAKTGEVCAVSQEDDDPEEYDNDGWAHIATLTATVPIPAVPVIRARVATGGGS